MGRRWDVPRGRAGIAIALAIGVVAAAFIAFLRPSVPDDTIGAIPWWRFEAGTAAILVAVAVVLRGRPGVMYPILAAASVGVAGSIEAAWSASVSSAGLDPGTTAGDPAYGLVLLAALARTAIPVAILSLYAAAPERRLGRWVTPAAWAISIATFVGAFLVLGRFMDQVSGQATWAWANDLSYALDEPVPLVALAILGLLGSLRAAARHQEPPENETSQLDGSVATAPSRMLLGAAGIAAVLWVPAAIAFLGRSLSLEDPEGTTNRLLFIPIIAALTGIVVERWSRIVAWLALAVAFETLALLPFYRGAADYVAFALTLPIGSAVPMPLAFIFFVAAATIVLLFAYASVAVALRDAVPSAAPSTNATDEQADRRWAVRGALVGAGLCTWFFSGAFLGSGVPVILGAGLLPMYALPVVLGLGIWRRLVAAVAEAESVALRPLRPFRYLETVVAETLTGRAGHRRRAASAERDRLSSELQAGVLANLERVASTNAAGAPREEIGERLRELQAAIRTLIADGRQVAFEPAYPGAGLRPLPPASSSGLPRPTERELEVMRLVAAGASNEQVARELFLSLKTVESHLRRLFGRYGVTNRTELAVLAVREGWVDAPGRPGSLDPGRM